VATSNENISGKFARLSIRQKTIFSLILCAMALCFAGGAIHFFSSFLGKMTVAGAMAKANGVILKQAPQIEEDLEEFSKISANEGTEYAGAKAAIEGLASDCETECVVTEMVSGQIGPLTIARLRVDFNRTTLKTLVEFFTAVEVIGKDVAVSAMRIDALGGGMLRAHYIISVLVNGAGNI
jgi:hypothetical protein